MGRGGQGVRRGGKGKIRKDRDREKAECGEGRERGREVMKGRAKGEGA